jgi:hypothetical protein
MKAWGLALLIQVTILALGLGFMGARFLEIKLFHAPLVNLLLWTGIISLAGLAASAAGAGFHHGLGRLLLVAAAAWFPVSLLIFGNARFSGTSDFLWQTWLVGTGMLVLSSLMSLIVSGAHRAYRWWCLHPPRR